MLPLLSARLSRTRLASSSVWLTLSRSVWMWAWLSDCWTATRLPSTCQLTRPSSSAWRTVLPMHLSSQ